MRIIGGTSPYSTTTARKCPVPKDTSPCRPLSSPSRVAHLAQVLWSRQGTPRRPRTLPKSEEGGSGGKPSLGLLQKVYASAPAYFGDLDETQSGDGSIEYEREAEEAEWREAQLRIHEVLEIPADDPIPDPPRGSGQSAAASLSDSPPQMLHHRPMLQSGKPMAMTAWQMRTTLHPKTPNDQRQTWHNNRSRQPPHQTRCKPTLSWQRRTFRSSHQRTSYHQKCRHERNWKACFSNYRRKHW